MSVIVDDKHVNFHDHDTFVMGNIALPTEATIEDYGDEEDSPYEEVRASVSNTDDPDMPVQTLRMWFLGLSLTLAGAAVNTFFNFRAPTRYVIAYAVM